MNSNLLLHPSRSMRPFAAATPSSPSTYAASRCMLRRIIQHRGGLAAKQTCEGRGRLQVVCMAHPRRVARVSSQIQREIADLFVSDPVFQSAICPERRLGDDTLSAVASITNTYVSNDLQVVKVYVSVYSDDYGRAVAMKNLQRLQPYVRRLIGQRVQLRLTPEIRFVYDDSEEEADLVARVIGREEVARYRAELEAGAAPGSGRQGGSGGEPEDGKEEEDGEGAEEGDEYEEEQEYDDEDFEDPDERPQVIPDPFGDLFTGNGEELLQQRSARRSRR